MSQESLRSIVSPKSIAVIGASNRPESIGNAVVENILNGGYRGKLYPINPSTTEVLGIKCYASVIDVPESIDLAVIIVPSKTVPQVLEDCGKKKVKGAIIISAGFKESGKEGRMLEEQVAQIAKKHGIRLVGPNCVGLINSTPEVSLNASFTKRMPKFGTVSLVSQSGAICGAMLEYAKIKAVGFSKVFSLGNKADINENDVLSFLSQDPTTKVVLMYVEDLADANNFIRIASDMTRRGVNSKPILAMKVGQSTIGTKAIASHTGALAGSAEAYDAIFKQAGIIKTETLEQLFDYALAFSYQPVPRGGGCVVVSNAGGPAAITADASVRYGLKLAKLSEKTINGLKTILPKNAMIINPIDMIGDSDTVRYEKALRFVLQDENVDSCIVISTPLFLFDNEALANVIVKISKEFKEKTVLACITSFMENEDAEKILDSNHVPQYSFPETATAALAVMQEFGAMAKRPPPKIEKYAVDKAAARKIIDDIKKEGRTYLAGPQAMKILRSYGFATVEPVLARNEEECVQMAAKVGYPLVLKISSPDIVHKVDVGGVEIDLKNETEVRNAFQKIMNSVKKAKPDAVIRGITIEQFVKDGKEMIIGSKRDPQFGPLIMFGTGGIYVSIFNDVSFGLAPLSDFDASKMIDSTKASKILAGTRGEKPYDRLAVIDCLKRLSQMVTEIPEILELDVNPLLVFEKGKGCKALDVRIVISDGGNQVHKTQQ
ncbi:MAG: acetate--CoA ligase family protein [Thaumarchaeota archaeon]|nr:acetate--CoA ligase family protein [Nitrososphaerota archaeon]